MPQHLAVCGSLLSLHACRLFVCQRPQPSSPLSQSINSPFVSDKMMSYQGCSAAHQKTHSAVVGLQTTTTQRQQQRDSCGILNVYVCACVCVCIPKYVCRLCVCPCVRVGVPVRVRVCELWDTDSLHVIVVHTKAWQGRSSEQTAAPLLRQRDKHMSSEESWGSSETGGEKRVRLAYNLLW